MTRDRIEELVLAALRNANLARDPSAQLAVAPGAPIFGSGSPLDSLGLVALLLDIEDALRDGGTPLVLSDDRAVSQKRSPFRTVTSLVDYIESLLQAEQA
jgi:hypothetical protein